MAAQCGSNAAWFECDVTDSEALGAAVEGAVERFGGIDVVMANAGIAPVGMVRSTDPDAFERTIEINLIGVWRTVRACLPQVIERRGYVLVIASLAAAMHAPGMAAYSASKAGAEAFANSLRVEVKHLGVDVGVGYFSFIDTDMVRGGDEHPAVGGSARERREAVRRRPIRSRRRARRSPTGSRSAGAGSLCPAGRARCWCCARRWLRSSSVGSRRLRRRGRGPFRGRRADRGAEAASQPVGPGGEAGAGRERTDPPPQCRTQRVAGHQKSGNGGRNRSARSSRSISRGWRKTSS